MGKEFHVGISLAKWSPEWSLVQIHVCDQGVSNRLELTVWLKSPRQTEQRQKREALHITIKTQIERKKYSRGRKRRVRGELMMQSPKKKHNQEEVKDAGFKRKLQMLFRTCLVTL